MDLCCTSVEVEDVARGQDFEVIVSRVATETDCKQSVFRPGIQCEYPRREKEKRLRQRGETSACMRLGFLSRGQTSEVMCGESTRERHELLDYTTGSTMATCLFDSEESSVALGTPARRDGRQAERRAQSHERRAGR